MEKTLADGGVKRNEAKHEKIFESLLHGSVSAFERDGYEKTIIKDNRRQLRESDGGKHWILRGTVRPKRLWGVRRKKLWKCLPEGRRGGFDGI
jgi:hypothetical protein